MPMNRRDFLKSLLAVPAAAALPGMVHAMAAPPGAGPRNLILLDLDGGVDGVNMVVPFGVDGGVYYSDYRPSLNVPLGQVLSVGATPGGASHAQLGFHPALAELATHYEAGRLAVVQGVGYDNQNFSHDVAQRIWQTADPTLAATDGWLARWLQTQPPGEDTSPVAATLTSSPTRLVNGSPAFVPSFKKLSNFAFPFDSQHFSDGDNRRATYAAMTSGLLGDEGPLGTMAQTSTGILALIETFEALPEFNHVGAWPEASRPRQQLQLVMRILAADVGMRYFHVPFGGFDTHADQELDGFFTDRLTRVSQCLDALYADLSAAGLAQDTLVVVFSEFGRTMYENGSGGSDHGSAVPVLVFGDCVNGGFTTPHPSLDPAQLSDQDEMVHTTDLRDVFGTLVGNWLDTDPTSLFPGHTVTDLGFVTT